MNRSDDLFPQPGGTPDPYWQRAFDDAFDTPPPRVWEGVERQLDLDESDGILPLWQHREGRQSMLFGRWAAGIAASLMLTALGWWAWHREDAIRPDVAVAIAAKSQETRELDALLPTGPVVASAEATNVHTQPIPRLAEIPTVARRRMHSGQDANQETTLPDTHLGDQALAVAGKSVPQADAPPLFNQQAVSTALSQIQEVNNGTLIFTEATTSTLHLMNGPQSIQSGMTSPDPSSALSRSVVTHSVTTQSFSQQPAGAQSFTRRSVTVQAQGTSGFSGAIAGFSRQSLPMQIQGGQLPPNAFQQAAQPGLPTPDRSALTGAVPERTALVGAPLAASPSGARQQSTELVANADVTAAPASTTSKKQRQRPWLSAGVAASAFSPAVAVRPTLSTAAVTAQPAFSSGNMNAALGSPASLQNQVGRSVAFQAGIGIPLGEHWSVETGVGYLSSQNEIQSPSRISSLTSAIRSAGSDNLYVDLVARLANQYNATSANTSADKMYDYTLANQANNYTAVQQQAVSNSYQFVQVPLQVGYELRPRRKFGLALLTGMVSNWFVRNTVADAITVKAGDGVYRPVTLAGTAGMRLRYRPDHIWSASVAGTFQQSLQSLTRSDVSLQAQPQQVGLSFSVDRHF
ncbi:hypothetical protein JYG30_11655 [Fibrella sp. USSR17]